MLLEYTDLIIASDHRTIIYLDIITTIQQDCNPHLVLKH